MSPERSYLKPTTKRIKKERSCIPVFKNLIISSSSEWQRRQFGAYYASQDIFWCLIYYYSWSGQAQDFASPHFSGG
ncbi:hypothetical protein PNOK_0918000 [Pyrrhoderma noxium]|uniref:Uncharacterized protein n=1 Tax=Pyrrhoderma noxium TaxID=2282107 RepID=A0A286U752_9AGAM|nr:hypothetical protein PNOK_0918000 [Pyrrhoderma noxium]